MGYVFLGPHKDIQKYPVLMTVVYIFIHTSLHSAEMVTLTYDGLHFL